MSKNLPALVISGIVISQDAEGRFSLNDLHKAAVDSGANKRTTEPGKFLASPQTQGLIAELEKQTTQNPGSYPVSTIEGRNGGSSVVKELVYRYAMSISPVFELKVIRAYDALATGACLAPGATLESLSPALASQIGGIIKSVVHKQIADALRIELPLLLHGELGKQRVSVRLGKTAGQIWRDYNLPERLKGAAQWFSRRLVELNCQISGGGCSESGGIPSKLFDPDKVSVAMKGGLLGYCKQYGQQRGGQAPLFPKGS